MRRRLGLLPTPRWLWSWLKVTKFIDVIFAFRRVWEHLCKSLLDTYGCESVAIGERCWGEARTREAAQRANDRTPGCLKLPFGIASCAGIQLPRALGSCG